MKKKLLLVFLFVCLAACLALVGCGDDKPEKKPAEKPAEKYVEMTTEQGTVLSYTLQTDDTYAVAIKEIDAETEITVPSSVGKTAVTAVAENGFSAATNITSVTLPSSVAKISAHAFDGCAKLDTLKIGESAEKVNFFVFNGKYTSEIDGVSVGEYAFDNTAFMSVDIADSDKTTDDTLVKCTVKNRFAGAADVTVSSALNGNVEKKQNTVSANETEKTLDFGTYGLFKDIDVAVKTAGGDLKIENASGVAVTATRYNFAHLNASYPVLVFTLKLKEFTENGEIPTFVLLERSQQYDWNSLPYNVKPYPFLTKAEATSGGGHFHVQRAPLKAYIKELYELNPESHFTLFCVDNYGEIILEQFTANNIPEKNWNAVLLSDGNGTAANINYTFGIDDPETRYASMKTEYENLKTELAASGEFNATKIGQDMEFGSRNPFSVISRYAYVIAREQANVEWYVNRLRPTENLNAVNNAQGGAEFITELRTHVHEVYTNNLLAALGQDEQETFKKLYKFNENMFDDAVNNEKEAVIILGTSWGGENGNLYENIKLLVELYGTEKYEYYYKGHPGYPTSQYTGRQEYFKALADEGYVIHELENAIAAEIILFYNPEVNMAGYKTSTFDSVTEDTHDKALLLFGSKASFAEAPYRDYFDVFASKLNVAADKDKYGGITFDENERYFLLEYNNTEKYANQTANYAKHEIAIYTVSSKQIKYYKKNGDVYAEVTADGASI